MKADIKDLHKRKLVNLVMQGEAKNTKHILHMPEVRDGLNRILGNQDGERMFQALDRITKAADKMDWLIPTEHRAGAMEYGDNFGGAVDVEWE